MKFICYLLPMLLLGCASNSGIVPIGDSGALARYVYAIQQKIQRNWVEPPSATAGLKCVVNVRQLPGGEVVGAAIGQCNGDEAVRQSIEAAVFKASPLPEPEDPLLFDRNLRIEFKPEQ